MRNFMHYLIMWIPFILLVALATFGMEYFEGNKITTTEYLSLNDIGPFFILFIGAAVGFVIYPFTFLPLTILFSLFNVKTFWRYMIAALMGATIGAFYFYNTYSSDHINEYGLTPFVPILLFLIIGFVYIGCEKSFKKNIQWE